MKFRFLKHRRIFMILAVLVPASLAAQALRGSHLDASGFTLDFGADAAGRSVTVMAINLGRLGHRTIDGDGHLRIDLTGAPLPHNGHACFFVIRDSDGQLVSLSSQRGFYNPLWENGHASGAATPRDPATIAADRAQFEADAAAAHAWLSADAGKIYAGGACRPASRRVVNRPAFAYDPPMSRIYAVQRCTAVFAQPHLTCAAARDIAHLGGDRALSGPACDAHLTDSAAIINSVNNAVSADDAATARDFARRAAATPDSRADAAGACVAAVSARAEQRLRAWRQAHAADDTDREVATCQNAAAVLADEDDRRAALTAELASAQAMPRSRDGRIPTDTRSYPCALN